MATDFIVDFETLGVTDDSVLLSVGILPCPDISGTYTVKDLISSGLYIKFNREQQYKAGRKLDSNTLEWWEKQGDAAKIVLSNTNLHDIVKAQLTIRSFMFEHGFDKRESKIWSRGMIDQRWWQSFCMTCATLDQNVNDFLPFQNWRDIRTILEVLTGSTKGSIQDDDPRFIKHNALSDCVLDYLRMQNALLNN